MLVPRAFSYRSKSSSPPSDASEKRPIRRPQPSAGGNVRGFGWRPASFAPPKRDASVACTSDPAAPEPARPLDQSSPPRQQQDRPTTPSMPVAVPSKRGVRDAAHTSSSTLPGSSSRQGQRSVTPAVAAVLASTSIPRRTAFPKRASPSSAPQRISIDELVESWKQSDAVDSSSLGTSPAMEMLLSPPEELDEDPLSQFDDDDDSGSPTRTMSGNSIPSLDDSSQSGVSMSVPSTPGINLRGEQRRDRVVSSLRSADVGQDHPLHPNDQSPELESRDKTREPPPMALPLPSLPVRAPSTRQASATATGAISFRKAQSFRSNLTASLNGLRSNLSRTFSNFSAPSVPLPVDHLTRSFLGGAPYHPEMRPRPMSGVPDSRLRRYMNPHAFQPYDFHLHNQQIHDADLELVVAAHAAAVAGGSDGDAPRSTSSSSSDMLDAIPMESFVARSAAGSSSTAASATEAGRARSAVGEQRREPRENPEFLRIAVLELQMRRAGKTEGPPIGFGAGMGRRGWWLAPRGLDEAYVVVEPRRKGDVPRRWAGVSAAAA